MDGVEHVEGEHQHAWFNQGTATATKGKPCPTSTGALGQAESENSDCSHQPFRFPHMSHFECKLSARCPRTIMGLNKGLFVGLPEYLVLSEGPRPLKMEITFSLQV